MPMVPSVTMNGSIRPNVTIRPLARPQAALKRNGAQSCRARACLRRAPPTLLSVRIITPATSAAMEPTERSSPPPEITKVAPTAMMAMKAERVTTFMRLETVRKSGLMREPATTSTKRAMNGESARMIEV